MTTIPEALNEIVAALKGADLAATADASRLELPGILVMPGDMSFPYLDDSQFDMDFTLWLLARDIGPVETWGELQVLLQGVRTVYQVVEAVPINRPLANQSSEPVPALLITIKTTIS